MAAQKGQAGVNVQLKIAKFNDTCKIVVTDRCFAVAAAALWNGLLDSVRTAKIQPQFKTLLKTHLFRLAFL